MPVPEHLAAKQSYLAHGQRIVVFKRPHESSRHVLMKVMLWALYVPEHPSLTIEAAVQGERYKPDVVATDDQDRPTLWGELGQVKPDKIRALARRYADAHVVIGKWGGQLGVYDQNYRKSLRGVKRRAPVDLLVFPTDAAERFFTPDGEVTIALDDLERVRLAD